MTLLLALLAALLCLLLPGLAWLVWFGRADQPFWERAADAVGASLGLNALLALVFYLAGLPPGGWGAGLYLGACLLACAAAALRGRAGSWNWSGMWQSLAGLAALAGLLALRFYQARDLVLPNWVDSVHHTLIVRAMLDYGGLPETLAPYLDVPLSYHFGFHISAAIFAFLSGEQPSQAVLWLGQVINALVSLSIYRLGRAAGLDRRAGLLAAGLSGFVFYMPGYYLSWGRYTLLSGLVILPLAMAAVQDLHHNPRDLKGAARLALLSAGLCLTHYLGLLLFLFYLAVTGLAGLANALRRRDARQLPWLAAGACLLGALLALPWLARMLVLNAGLLQVGDVKLSLSASDFGGLASLLRPPYNQMLMCVAAFCVLLALLQPGLRKLAAWGLALVFFAMPFAPQLGPFRADLFIIVLFLPAALLLGWGLVAGADALAALLARGRGRRLAWGRALILGAAVVPLLLLGVLQTRDVLNASTRIVDAADLAALDWVRTNIPADARFYVNSTLWMQNIYRGVDGGYWLLPYTGRSGLVPPVFYTQLADGQGQQVNDLAGRSEKLTGCTPEFWTIVREAALTHVYVRQGRGSLQAAALDQCPRLQGLYRAGGVSIYAILQP